MKQLKNLKFVLFVLVVLLILVIIRNSSQNLFKADVKTALEAAQNKNNSISFEQLKKRSGAWMLVSLGSENIADSIHSENSIHIPFEKILDQSNLKVLKEIKGDVILYSADASKAAEAWVILNQLGFNNLYILTSGEDPEELKYKFQPDTTVRLEQDSI